MGDPRKILLPPPPTQRDMSFQPGRNYVGDPVRDTSAYAMDLASWQNSHKHKFLFVTEIKIHPHYVGIADMTRFALLTQTASRPKMKFEHQEYNEYGIRKGVLTKTIFEPINLSFIDDNQNSVMQFFTNVLKLMSPITNIDEAKLIDSRQYDFKTAHGSLTNISASPRGINVQERTTGNYRPNVYAQSSGYPGEPLAQSKTSAESATSIFESVKIHHIHLFGEGVNTFTFKNPRLLSMDFDDLDMASSDDIATLKMSFGYDYLTSASGTMTAEISRLVGPSMYYLRRDLSRDSGGVVNQQRQTTTVNNAGATASNTQHLTPAQIEAQSAQIAAARAQAEVSDTPAEAARYAALATGLQSPKA